MTVLKGDCGCLKICEVTRRKKINENPNFNDRRPVDTSIGDECMCEIALATLNAGAYGCLAWSFCDYPDPMIAEDGDTSAEHVKYAATRCVYRPDLKYNKWGSYRWGDTEGDYRVFCNGRQIASTVATSCRVADEKAAYSVVSVDRWGNVSRHPHQAESKDIMYVL